jgi:hypothetical protein
MDGGRSILGVKGSRLVTQAKACLDMGLASPYPSIFESRLVKCLLSRYPEYAAARFYRNEDSALSAAIAIDARGPRTLRPFAEYHVDAVDPGRSELAMPLLPCPRALAPGILLFRDAKTAEASPGDLVPPLAIASAYKSLLELERYAKIYDESLWRKSDKRLKPFFERRGPYLYPRASEKGYGAVFEAALGAGVLLSPAREQPSIVPGDFDDGELAALAGALASKA